MIGMQIFWLAPLFPLTVFVLLALGLSRSGRLASALAVIAMAGSTVVSILGLISASQGMKAIVSLPWLSVGGRTLTLALWFNPLSALVATLVSVVGLIIFVYAVSYMAEEPRRGRFFAEFSLFAGSMLVLVLAADLITLFITWELVGVCSFLLIGFWFERDAPPGAATKAFLTTRIADVLLLAGVLLLLGNVGSGRIDVILEAGTNGKIAPGLLLFIALLLFAGAAGKSAQIPFQGWLPDAMAGPTPVSALLHSATMVAAGVFLIARLYPLFLVATPSLQIIAWVGVLTSLLGGAAALVETDLKRTLAYSTMSQIGLMFVGLGSGSLLAGVLLLVAQALYKATLFLAAGAVDRAVDEHTTFEYMGGLLRRMPLTALAFALSAAALAGLPVTLALPPKDPVLAAAWLANMPLFIAALVASLLTALYSTRTFGLVFLGVPSTTAQKAHETTRGLLIPLLVLAVLIPLGLLMNATLLGQPLSHLLGGRILDASTATVLTLAIAILGVVVALLARFAWPQSLVWPALQTVQPLLSGEFGFKAFYRLVARLGLLSAALLNTFDTRIFERFAGAVARATVSVVRVSGRVDVHGFDDTVKDLGQTILALGQRVRVLQTGRIENYLLLVFMWGIGVVALAVLATLLR
ncbi:MAG: NADH-quinone oxidoreductase subunit L [Ktedonobacteraceae bacterium]